MALSSTCTCSYCAVVRTMPDSHVISLHCAFQLLLYMMIFLIYKTGIYDTFFSLNKSWKKEIKSLVCVYGFLIYV